MEHSKGPWETDGRIGHLDIVCPKGRIAMMDCEDDAFWAAELEANANLIAAAPDMLAALTCCLDMMEGEDLDELHGDLAEVVRAAIAKAKGRA